MPLFQCAQERDNGIRDVEFAVRFVLDVAVRPRVGVEVDELELELFEER